MERETRHQTEYKNKKKERMITETIVMTSDETVESDKLSEKIIYQEQRYDLIAQGHSC